MVAIFHKQTIHQGLFKKSIFKRPLNHHFGWVGILSLLTGSAVAIVSLSLSVRGWPIERLWLYLLMSSMIILVGVQLITYWLLLRVLASLGKREPNKYQDMIAA
jgi:hypothetical protein